MKSKNEKNTNEAHGEKLRAISKLLQELERELSEKRQAISKLLCKDCTETDLEKCRNCIKYKLVNELG